MANVDILLASYNGTKYIEAQICSIICQSYKDWRLMIHDDGSQDTTVDIVKKWQKIDPRIELIEDGVKCGGASANFMHLITFADAQFVMFADQDDIWFDNKIEVMISAMESKDNRVPQVLYTNLYAWFPDRGIEGCPVRTFPKDLRHFLFLNTAMHGCIVVFNRLMLNLMKRWEGVTIMHDQSLQMIAVSLGQVEYMELPLMLYRRHDTSVTGDTIIKLNDVERLVKASEIPVLYDEYYHSVKYFYNQYNELLSDNDKQILERFLSMKNMSMLGRLCCVIFTRFKLYDSIFRLLVKIVMRKYISK